jgi:hypothetical protein
MRSWVVILGCVTSLAAASCGDPGGSDAGGRAGGEPLSLVGETEQGLRLRIDRVGDRDVSLRFPVNCGSDDNAVPLHRHRIETEVDGDGRFSVEEDYVDDGTDGDEEHVEVRIEGAFAADGTATGTLDVTSRWWNGQGNAFGPDCESGTVGWTADRPPVEGHDLVVPVAEPTSLTPAGTDVVVVSSDSGAVVHIDGETGETRPVGGAEPSGPTGADPSAPTTVVAGGAASPAVTPSWMRDMAVVADGVWMVDPATGVVSRFELADGARTATIAAPIDSLVAGPDALWTVSTNEFHTGYALDRRDPVTGAIVASTPVERGVVIVGPAGVWYADTTWDGGRLAPVDPTTLAIGEPFDADVPLFGEHPVTTADRIWWLDDTQRLTSIELAGGRTSAVDPPGTADAMAADATGVWTVHEQEAVARRIEGDRVVRTVDLPDGFWSVAVTADGAVWLAGRGDAAEDPRVVRLDPAVTTG